ncbi:MAG: hypothetical protein JSS72_06385 [Armatimonadetes bacterium]|nr:hypothetical protein [Armatimonadota bacterium]
MNHITGGFSRVCPGVVLHQLHRKGRNQKDLFGSDIAVLLFVGDKLLKFAFIQLKVAKAGKATFEKNQIVDALRSGYPPGAFFLMTIESTRFDCSVTETCNVNNAMIKKATVKQLTVKTSGARWWSFRDWVKAWISCSIGTLHNNVLARDGPSLIQLARLDELDEEKPGTWAPSMVIEVHLESTDSLEIARE